MFGILHLPLFVAAVFLLNVTPGPDTAYIVGRSVAQGRGAGLVSALGISGGCCVHMVASAVGLTALLAASAAAFTVMKVVGAIYLIYLGGRLILSSKAATPGTTRSVIESNAVTSNGGVNVHAMRRGMSARGLFSQGFLTNLLNPKVVLFFVSFFPQFVAPDSARKTLAFLLLGAIFVVMSTIWNSFVAWIAGSVSRGIADRPIIKTVVDRVVGAAFVGLGVKLALTRH